VAQGFIYVLDNASMPGLLKIGATERTPDERARELSRSTGVPSPFVTRFSARVSDWREAEAAIHRGLDQFRSNKSREFFRIEVKAAIDAAHAIAERYKPAPPIAERYKPAPPDAGEARCPKCGFAYGWTGVECRHCHFTPATTSTPDLLDHLYGLSPKAKEKKAEDDFFNKLYG